MTTQLAQGPTQLHWWRVQAPSDLRGCPHPPCSMGQNSDTQRPAEAGGRTVDGTHHGHGPLGRARLILSLFPREDSLEMGSIDRSVSCEL